MPGEHRNGLVAQWKNIGEYSGSGSGISTLSFRGRKDQFYKKLADYFTTEKSNYPYANNKHARYFVEKLFDQCALEAGQWKSDVKAPENADYKRGLFRTKRDAAGLRARVEFGGREKNGREPGSTYGGVYEKGFVLTDSDGKNVCWPGPGDLVISVGGGDIYTPSKTFTFHPDGQIAFTGGNAGNLRQICEAIGKICVRLQEKVNQKEASEISYYGEGGRLEREPQPEFKPGPEGAELVDSERPSKGVLVLEEPPPPIDRHHNGWDSQPVSAVYLGAKPLKGALPLPCDEDASPSSNHPDYGHKSSSTLSGMSSVPAPAPAPARAFRMNDVDRQSVTGETNPWSLYYEWEDRKRVESKMEEEWTRYRERIPRSYDSIKHMKFEDYVAERDRNKKQPVVVSGWSGGDSPFSELGDMSSSHSSPAPSVPVITRSGENSLSSLPLSSPSSSAKSSVSGGVSENASHYGVRGGYSNNLHTRERGRLLREWRGVPFQSRRIVRYSWDEQLKVSSITFADTLGGHVIYPQEVAYRGRMWHGSSSLFGDSRTSTFGSVGGSDRGLSESFDYGVYSRDSQRGTWNGERCYDRVMSRSFDGGSSVVGDVRVPPRYGGGVLPPVVGEIRGPVSSSSASDPWLGSGGSTGKGDSVSVPLSLSSIERFGNGSRSLAGSVASVCSAASTPRANSCVTFLV